MPASQAEATALIEAQGTARAALTAQMVAVAATSAANFTGWYSADQITAWAANLVKTIESLQRVLAQSTDAYLARYGTLVTGQRIRPTGRIDVSALRVDVTHAGSYARAADVYRYQQSLLDGVAKQIVKPDVALDTIEITADPLTAAVERVSKVADMDAQLVVQRQTKSTLIDQAKQGRKIIGYRRVLHSELSKFGSCGLCVAASTRLYHIEDLQALHNECKCEPTPVYSGASVSDFAAFSNTIDLEQLYETAGDTGRAKLKATRYQVDEHGELGPVLNSYGTEFRGPSTVKRASKPAAAKAKSPTEIRRNLVSLHAAQLAALPRARELAAGDAKEWGKYLTSLEARIADLAQQIAA